ncbi:MAG: thiopurine S-methyltransferase [Myxococcales bacterium]|nr:thiopurine S-methyltransferase [Myxococcales bacterium]
MKAAFWHERWSSQRIGFHLPVVNPNLKAWWPTLNVPQGSRVLVPLCGKTSDMVWLHEQGCEVVGVELSEVACRSFFEDNDLPYRTENEGDYTRWIGEGSAKGLTVVQGDFFQAPLALIGPVSALYDRASLIALPPEMRVHHCAQLARLLPPGAPGLMITIAYPRGEKQGPPFSVPTAEVQALTHGHFEVSTLADKDLLTGPNPENRWNLSSLHELVHLVTRVNTGG